jgi:hypothetical protein
MMPIKLSRSTVGTCRVGNAMSETKPQRRWFSFSIRDLLWLTMVVALATGWWLERHSSNSWRSIRSEDGDVTINNQNTGERVFLRGDGSATATIGIKR